MPWSWDIGDDMRDVVATVQFHRCPEDTELLLEVYSTHENGRFCSIDGQLIWR